MNIYFKLALFILSMQFVHFSYADDVGTTSPSVSGNSTDSLYQKLRQNKATSVGSIESAKRDTFTKDRIQAMNDLAKSGKTSHQKDLDDAAKLGVVTKEEYAREVAAAKKAGLAIDQDGPSSPKPATQAAKATGANVAPKSASTSGPKVSENVPDELNFPGEPAATPNAKTKTLSH
jgi:hypothetical protein